MMLAARTRPNLGPIGGQTLLVVFGGAEPCSVVGGASEKSASEDILRGLETKDWRQQADG